MAKYFRFLKNIIVGCLLFFFVFKTISSVRAAATDQLDQLLQGNNCGELNQQCCDLSKVNIPQTNINLPQPFDVLTIPVNMIFNLLTDTVEKTVNTLRDFIYQKFESNIHAFCKDGTKPSDPNNLANCTCISEALENASRLCNPITATEKGQCLSCVTSQKGIWTAIGCVQSDLGTFISQKLLGWGVGLAGIIALLCIIYAAFQMQTSQGNPERIKKAQELLTSCIMGLMLIIFSIFILRLIGVDILRIPGLG